MKIFYTLLFVGALLTVGLMTYKWGFDFKALGSNRATVPVKWTAPATLPGGEALELKQMHNTQRILSEQALHLNGAELYIDGNSRSREEVYGAPKPKDARYTVCLVLADGTRLEARPRQADWARLDQDMADTIMDCLNKYRELRKRHGLRGTVREITNF
ncbi:MAG: hypothetical protein AB7E32_04705 [Desulfovibrio sp.]